MLYENPENHGQELPPAGTEMGGSLVHMKGEPPSNTEGVKGRGSVPAI